MDAISTQPSLIQLPVSGVQAVLWPGRDARHCLIYLNGLESNHTWFAAIAAKLAHAGVMVLALDRRGTGSNANLVGNDRAWLHDIAAALRWLEERQPGVPIHIGALCFGSLLAARFACMYADRIASLVFVAPGFATRVYPAIGALALALVAGLCGRVRRVPSPIQHESWFSALPAAQSFIRNDALRRRDFTLAEWLQTWRLKWALRRSRRPLNLPALVLLAEYDRIIDKNRNVKIIKKLCGPNTRVCEYPSTTHCLFFEPGIDLAGDIAAWLPAKAAN